MISHFAENFTRLIVSDLDPVPEALPAVDVDRPRRAQPGVATLDLCAQATYQAYDLNAAASRRHCAAALGGPLQPRTGGHASNWARARAVALERGVSN